MWAIDDHFGPRRWARPSVAASPGTTTAPEVSARAPEVSARTVSTSGRVDSPIPSGSVRRRGGAGPCRAGGAALDASNPPAFGRPHFPAAVVAPARDPVSEVAWPPGWPGHA